MDKQAELEARLANLEKLVAVLLETDPRGGGYEHITKQADHLLRRLRHLETLVPTDVGEGQFVRYLRATFDLLQNENVRLTEALYPYIALQTMGLDSGEVPLTRVLPVRVYLSDADGDVVQNSMWFLNEVLHGIGFRPTESSVVERGSWFVRAFSRSKELLTQEQVVARLQKLEHAAELAAIKTPQAEVDSKEAVAVRDLLTGIRDVPNAVIQVASLLIIKQTDPRHGERVLVRTLTSTEMMAIERGDVSVRDITGLLKLLGPHADQPQLSPEAEQSSTRRRLGE